MEPKAYINYVGNKVEQDVPKAIREAECKALEEQLASPHTPLGAVELIARRAEQMAIAMTGKQIADLEDKDERFREVHRLIHELKLRTRDLELLRVRYEEMVRDAAIHLEELKALADELQHPLRKQIAARSRGD